MQSTNNLLNHELWLFKAKQDLRAAKKLVKSDDDLADIAIYHAQQAGEKALKGFLVFSKQAVTKTHDLERLLFLCSQLDKSFDCLLLEAATLTPYSTRFRYPDDFMLPDKKDLYEAIEYAEKIIAFVTKKIKESGNVTLNLFLVKKSDDY